MRMWRNWQLNHRSASCGRNSEVSEAQRSKFGEAKSELRILGTARVSRCASALLKLNMLFMTTRVVHINADVAELADALDSGSSESNFMWVQVPSSAPNQYNPNLFPLGDGLGFIVFLSYDYFGNGVSKSYNSKPRKK